MQRSKERTVWSILLAVILVVSLGGYLVYVQRQFYHESTQNLLETYEQVDKTFTMFAQRNWNVLGEWGKTLERDETSTERYKNLKQFNEEKEQPFALFYLDLDKFKPVNDTYGHDMGDQLLKAVADRLRGCIRSTDLAFRIGGVFDPRR